MRALTERRTRDKRKKHKNKTINTLKMGAQKLKEILNWFFLKIKKILNQFLSILKKNSRTLAIVVIISIIAVITVACHKNSFNKILGGALVSMLTLFFALHFSMGEKAGTTQWKVLQTIYLCIIILGVQVFLHSLYCGSLWMCLFNTTFRLSSDFSKTISEVAKVIGIGSVFIMTILGALNKKEINISYDSLLDTKYPHYDRFILGHFALTVFALILSYLHLIGAATICLFAIIYDSFVIGYLFKFLILSPDKRRKEAIKKWRKQIDENAVPTDALLSNLIGEFDPGNGPDYTDLYDCILYGFNHMVEKAHPGEEGWKYESLRYVLNGISSVWLCLLKDKTMDERRQILENIQRSVRKANPQTKENVLIVIYLGYLYAMRKKVMGESESYTEHLCHIYNELHNNMPLSSSLTESMIQKIPEYGFAMLFWIAFLGNDLTGSKNQYKGVSTIRDNKKSVSKYKELFINSVICIYSDGSIGPNLKLERLGYLTNIAWEMVFG